MSPVVRVLVITLVRLALIFFAAWFAFKEDALGEGVSMLTAQDLNDRSSDRIARHLKDFQTALAPEPDLEDWEAWQDLLRRPAEDDPFDAMTIDTETGFETVSSSLIALPGPDHMIGDEPVKPQWLFAAGRPDRFPYQPVAL